MDSQMAFLKTNTVAACLVCLLVISVPNDSRSDESFTTAEQRFSEFAMSWINRIQSEYLYSHQSPKIEVTATGYVASYHYLDKSSVEWEVKPAGGQGNLYTSVLYYREHLAQSRATTQEKAREGPFSIVKTKEIMEIFLYENGAWMR